jgi:predicted ATPase
MAFTFTTGDGIEVADVPALLAYLHDRCLITVDSRHETPRFVLLQAIRDYAREKLAESGEQPVVRRRHAQWCTDVAERTSKYGGPDHNELLNELISEEANLTAAIEWALVEQPDLVLGMVRPTSPTMTMTSPTAATGTTRS